MRTLMIPSPQEKCSLCRRNGVCESAFLVSRADSGGKIETKVYASHAFGIGSAFVGIMSQGAQTCASEYGVGSGLTSRKVIHRPVGS
jgi:hypothetical protein